MVRKGREKEGKEGKEENQKISSKFEGLSNGKRGDMSILLGDI